MDPAEKATVEGLVVKAGSGEPLQKAQVTLTGGGRPWPAAETRTDAAGRFLMANVEPGEYMLAAERNGYIRRVYGEADQAEANIFGAGTPLELEAGEHRRDIVFELIPAGVIAGRVLDEDHDPVPGAQVQAIHPVNMPGLPPWFPATNAAANDLGEYRLTGLRAGRYRVAACILSPHLWPGDQGGGLTYHPSVKDADQAALVEVAAGEEVRDIDIVLLPVRTACIRGRVVVGSDRDGVPGVLVRLMPQRPGFAGVGGDVHGHTDQQGVFEMRGLMAGDYKISAWWQAGGKSYNAELALAVGDKDLEGIELLLTAGASAGIGPLALAGLTLAGRLRVEGDAPISFPAWHVAVHPREPAGPGWGTQVAPDGSFLFHGAGALTLAETPASSYKISVSGPPSDFYLKSVLLGGKEVLETGFDLGAAESAPASLELVLSGDGGRIDGVVLDDQQRPAGGARVVLVPEPVCHGPDHMFNASLSTYNGRFTLRGIVPGEYRLCALEARWLGSFAAECESQGQRCRVEPRSSQNVSLRLIRKGESSSTP
ncbi:MAG TPA: carboxypeptidase-like regulatory domain-containing protein [Bryobacterales bacterium]|nr:carboxypeptidase-like regulatory domain-containing protein [Bryobacterales bacterium]